ncbi:MAG: hypothetical protein MUF74_11950 [Cypionkella sp.]|nr:hypothetical protein [Cypionkella sp.]
MVGQGGPGWQRIGPDPAIAAWAAAALSAARQVLARPGGDWRAGGTWFVGVDALENGPDGAVEATSHALPWAALGLEPCPLHKAQLSTTRPGYPRPDPGETEASFRFRRDRAAAHLDGLLAFGPEKRRMIREPHAFILGLPLTEADAEASPLVVWEGSHEIMRAALAKALAPYPAQDWANVDVTEAYQAARRHVFETCPRLALPARPGEALLLHRLLVHGVAPWAEGATSAPEGRVVAYFRPLLPDVSSWINLP